MIENLKYPSVEAVKSVLIKIGIDSSSRYDKNDQDIEYTTCRVNELGKYIDLYVMEDTTIYEKRVLGCYFLECLNEYTETQGEPHQLQEQAFSLLLSDIEIHETEVSYWSDTSDENADNWWPIAETLSLWLKQRNL